MTTKKVRLHSICIKVFSKDIDQVLEFFEKRGFCADELPRALPDEFEEFEASGEPGWIVDVYQNANSLTLETLKELEDFLAK